MTDRRKKSKKKRLSRKTSESRTNGHITGDSSNLSNHVQQNAAEGSESSPRTGRKIAQPAGPTTSAKSSNNSTASLVAGRVPRTLVAGTYRDHVPGSSLPEPLRQGFIDWADMQRRQPPRDEAEVMYNNRTLRYWRLSTDYSRFHPDDYDIMGGENGQNNNVVCNGAASSGDEGDGDTTDDDQVYEVVNGVAVAADASLTPIRRTLTYSFSAPQRPYTAPPHQLAIQR